MRIVVDLDDTLTYMVEYLLEVYNSEYQDNLKIEQITEWDLSKVVKPECGEAVVNYFKRPGWFLNPAPRKDAQKYLKKLVGKGHDIVIASAYANSPESCPDKYAYVRKHFPFIEKNSIFFLNKKDKLVGDVIIDDGWHNVRNFYGRKIIFDKPWNKKPAHFILGRVDRATNWKEVYNYIKKYSYND